MLLLCPQAERVYSKKLAVVQVSDGAQLYLCLITEATPGLSSHLRKEQYNHPADAVYFYCSCRLQGELEGYACKLDGFQRALQELEMQVRGRQQHACSSPVQQPLHRRCVCANIHSTEHQKPNCHHNKQQ